MKTRLIAESLPQLSQTSASSPVRLDDLDLKWPCEGSFKLRVIISPNTIDAFAWTLLFSTSGERERLVVVVYGLNSCPCAVTSKPLASCTCVFVWWGLECVGRNSQPVQSKKIEKKAFNIDYFTRVVCGAVWRARGGEGGREGGEVWHVLHVWSGWRDDGSTDAVGSSRLHNPLEKWLSINTKL